MAMICKSCGKPISEGMVFCPVCRRPAFPQGQPSQTMLDIFVGRSGEIKKLKTAFRQAASGQGRVITLVGEAGIGKTSLAGEFSRYAREQGAQIFHGSWLEGDWQPPYATWIEAFNHYACNTDREKLRRELGAQAGPIVQLAPALQTFLPFSQPPSVISPDEERLRLYSAIVQFFLGAAKTNTVVIILDDLQWADRDSLRLLGYLAQFIGRERILVVGAYREDIPTAGPRFRLADLIAGFQRESGYETIRLKGLNPEEVEQYLSQACQGAFSRDWMQAIYTATRGHPLFVREVVRHLTEKGVMAESRKGMPAIGIREFGMPPGVRDTVQARLSRLSPDTQALLRAASGFTGAFNIKTLCKLASLSVESALESLDEAIKAGFIQVAPGALPSPAYQFAHSIVKDVFYTGLNPDRRARLHRRIARLLEETHRGRQDQHAAELAWQYYSAVGLSGSQKGIEYALAAAGQSRAAGALDSAVTFLRMADEMSSQNSPEKRLDILFSLSVACAEALRFAEASHWAQEALKLSRQRKADQQPGAEFLAKLAWTMKYGGADEGLWRPLVEAELESLGSRRDLVWARLKLLCEEYAEIPFGPGVLKLWRGLDPEAVSIARASGQEEDYLRTVNSLDWRSREETEEFLSRVRTWRQPGAIMRALDIVSRDLLEHHSAWREALGPLEEFLEIARESGSIPGQAEALFQIGGAHLLLGELSLSGQILQKAREMVAILGPVHRLHTIELAMAALRSYYLDDGWPVLEKAMDSITANPASGSGTLALMSAAYGALVYSRVKDRETTVRQILSAITPVASRMEPEMHGQNVVTGMAGIVVWEMELAEFAGVYFRLASRLLKRRVGGGPLGPHELTLARMSSLLGERKAADRYFDLARKRLEEKGVRHLRAIVDYDQALALVRHSRVNRSQAGHLIEQALAVFQEMGMTGWIKRALALKNSPHRKAVNRPYPPGLTGREVEVLRRIADGQTNIGIARELKISLRTVESHINNLYNKIGAHGRANATAYALRQHLV